MATEISLAPSYLSKGLRGKYLLQEPKFIHDQGPLVDIGWTPDYEKYTSRAQKRQELPGLPQEVPRGWPQSLQSPLAWTADSFSSDEEIIYVLTESQKEEIRNAMEHFKGLNLHAREVRPETFPLPTLAPELGKISDELHKGRGFVTIRGLVSPDSSHEDDSIAFLGVSCYVAPQRGRQDPYGNMIVHILDANNQTVPKALRQSVYTNLAQPFHNDVFCDILALQTRSCAASGGNSNIASAWTVYNEIAATRPDLIHTLAADNWTFDTFGRDPPYHQRPLLFYEDGKLILNFSRRLLTGSPASPRTAGIPPMTEAQAEALDAVHFAALKHQISTPLQKGDIRFINNHAVLHGRDSFGDDEQSQRYLARLWLRHPEKAWRMPQGLSMASERVYAPLEDVGEEWSLGPVLTTRRLMARASCGQG